MLFVFALSAQTPRCCPAASFLLLPSPGKKGPVVAGPSFVRVLDHRWWFVEPDILINDQLAVTACIIDVVFTSIDGGCACQ